MGKFNEIPADVAPAFATRWFSIKDNFRVRVRGKEVISSL